MFRSMYLSNFHQFPTLSIIATHQQTKMAANDSQIKLKIKIYTQFFNINTGNAIKSFDAGVVDDTGVA